jgi:hypothetical protein
MREIIFIILLLIFYSSCKKEDRKSLIYEMNGQRKKSELTEFDDNFNLDSTDILILDEKGMFTAEPPTLYKDANLADYELKPNCSLTDFYSRKNSNLSKILYFNIKHGKTSLNREEDKYFKKVT